MDPPNLKNLHIEWHADPESPWLGVLRSSPELFLTVGSRDVPAPAELDARRIHVMDAGPGFSRLTSDPTLPPAACLVLLGHRETLDDPAAGAADLFLPADVEPCAPELVVLMLGSAWARARRRSSKAPALIEDFFLAAMSHELRTPLNNIIGIVDSLYEGVVGPTTAEQQRFLGFAKESAGHLLELINNILDLSKIEAGRMHVEIHAIDVSELVASAERLVFDAAFQKDLRVEISVSPEMPRIYGDERLLKQALVNLLSNAVKFTPTRGEVGLRTYPHRGGQALCIEVWDTGLGIDPEERHRVFEPFVQLDAGLTRAHEGTGLGLSLVRRLVELHGGAVSVASAGRESGGTCFTVTIPSKAKPAAIRAEDPPAALPEPATIDGLVLVVDDDELSRKIVAAYIEARGFGVSEAADGEEAVAIFKRLRPDAVVMDLGLPGMSGLEAIRRIRAASPQRRAIVAVLTAHTLEGTREECLRAGADLYFSKPARYRELVRELRKRITAQSEAHLDPSR
ncbi:MAG: ATP-binding protein [Acidobacteriota bacterium]